MRVESPMVMVVVVCLGMCHVIMVVRRCFSMHLVVLIMPGLGVSIMIIVMLGLFGVDFGAASVILLVVERDWLDAVGRHPPGHLGSPKRRPDGPANLRTVAR